MRTISDDSVKATPATKKKTMPNLETFSTTLGYRYLDVDYEKDDFLYDVSQDGPVLGLSWMF